jgi:hypothetical protein
MGKNYFAVEHIQVVAEGELVNRFLQYEQYVFCITITDLRNLTYNFAELINFFLSLTHTHTIKAHTAGRKWYWVYESTLTSKSGTATG